MWLPFVQFVVWRNSSRCLAVRMGLCFVIVNVKLTFVFIGEKEPLRAFGHCQEQHLGRTVAFAKIRNVSKRRNKRAKSFTRSGAEMNVVLGNRGGARRVVCFVNTSLSK